VRFEFADGGRLGALLGLLGMGRRHSWTAVEGARFQVRMGWAFRLETPAEAIASAGHIDEPIPLMLGIGVHGWRRQWAVNTARTPHVVVRFTAPQPARTLGFPIQVEALHLSPADPTGLIQALRG
jgi:hypothetical protein